MINLKRDKYHPSLTRRDDIVVALKSNKVRTNVLVVSVKLQPSQSINTSGTHMVIKRKASLLKMSFKMFNFSPFVSSRLS